MSPEAGLIAIGKWLWTVFIPYLIWRHKEQDQLKSEMKSKYYTKAEVKEQIELRQQPILQEMESQKAILGEIKDGLKELRNDIKEINRPH